MQIIKKKANWLRIIEALILSVIMIVGESFIYTGDFSLIANAPGFYAVSFAIYFFMFYYFSDLAEESLRKAAAKHDGELTNEELKKYFISVGVFLFICYLPYLIAFYPCVASGDIEDQIIQSFNLKTGSVGAVDKVLSEDVMLNSHHPVFNTLVQSLFVRIGMLLGSQNLGLFLHTLYNTLFGICVYSLCFTYLRKLGAPKALRIALILIYALVPCFPMYTVNITKNVIHAFWVLLGTFGLVKIAESKGELLKSNKVLILFGATLLLGMLNIKQGVMLVVLMGVFFVICYRKYIKRAIIVIAAPVAVYILFSSVLLPALNVSPASAREGMGVMFQQTARYIVNYPDEVTKEEKEAIDRVLEYDKIAEKYVPAISDGVKELYRKDQTGADKAAYLKAWFSMFLKHPLTYVEATINGCYGFFYPGSPEWYEYYDFPGVFVVWYPEMFQMYNPQRLDGFRAAMSNVVMHAKNLPVIRYFFRHGTYMFILIWAAFTTLRKKNLRHFTSLMMLIGSMLVLIATPWNANTRYAAPVFLGLSHIILVVYAMMREHTDKTVNPTK